MTVYSKNWKNYEIFKPTITSDKFRYITLMTFNLPGTGDTMIKRVVRVEASALHPAWLKPAIS